MESELTKGSHWYSTRLRQEVVVQQVNEICVRFRFVRCPVGCKDRLYTLPIETFRQRYRPLPSAGGPGPLPAAA